MKTLSCLLLASALTVPILVLSAAPGTDWRQWRGPDGTGYAPDGCKPPIEWNETKNLKWKTKLPGKGQSTPIILGDMIYVTTAIEQTDKTASLDDGTDFVTEVATPPTRGGRNRGNRRGGGRGGRGAAGPTNVHDFVVMGVNRSDGSIAWQKTLCSVVPHEGIHRTSSFASSSPVTDGEHLYVFFGSRGLYCLDLKGNEKWSKDFGDMRTRNSFGEGATPGLHGNTLVVPWDHEDDSFVVAVDKRTGAEKWRSPREEATNWTTPVIVTIDGKPQAVVAGRAATISYDLETGKEMWRCTGMTMNVIPTPVVGNGMIYLTSGFRGNALQAIKLSEAKGDISDSAAIVWSHDKGTPYVPSPVLAGDRLYILRGNNGIISCFDAHTGEQHYDGQRLDMGSVYASPVGANGHIYVCGREGEVVVLEDGPEFKVLASNAMDEGIDASLAIVDNEIYLRGSEHLFCIAEPTPTTSSTTASP